MGIVSCGGVVIFRGKVLLLYRNKQENGAGWVLPKGKQELNESYEHAAVREVEEETGAKARIIKHIGRTQYSFQGAEAMVSKTVHWYLMAAESFYSKPQAEEFFSDAGFYKQHEAYHLLKYHNEREMLCRAFEEYDKLRRNRKWR